MNRQLLFQTPPPQKTRRQRIFSWLQTNLKQNPCTPFILRLFELAMSITTLGLGAEIFRLFYNKNIARNSKCKRGATTYMAIDVGALGVIYIACIADEEFFPKFIGQRKPCTCQIVCRSAACPWHRAGKGILILLSGRTISFKLQDLVNKSP